MNNSVFESPVYCSIALVHKQFSLGCNGIVFFKVVVGDVDSI